MEISWCKSLSHVQRTFLFLTTGRGESQEYQFYWSSLWSISLSSFSALDSTLSIELSYFLFFFCCSIYSKIFTQLYHPPVLLFLFLSFHVRGYEYVESPSVKKAGNQWLVSSECILIFLLYSLFFALFCVHHEEIYITKENKKKTQSWPWCV